MKAVLTNIHSLGRAAQKLRGYAGPVLGAKLATANSRDFSDRHDSYLNKIGGGRSSSSQVTKVDEDKLWPTEQAELTLLQMLAAAAEAAVKKAKVQKKKAEE
eukprot:6576151-Prymnesium_polylepis.1